MQVYWSFFKWNRELYGWIALCSTGTHYYIFKPNVGNGNTTRVTIHRRCRYRAQQLESSSWQGSSVPLATPQPHQKCGALVRERSFLKTKATSSTLRDEVSCLQRDQSYVVGGVYILRGSMELRESLGTPSLLRHPPFPAEPSVALLLSLLLNTYTHVHVQSGHTCDLRSRASLADAPPSFSRSNALTHTHVCCWCDSISDVNFVHSAATITCPTQMIAMPITYWKIRQKKKSTEQNLYVYI